MNDDEKRFKDLLNILFERLSKEISMEYDVIKKDLGRYELRAIIDIKSCSVINFEKAEFTKMKLSNEF